MSAPKQCRSPLEIMTGDPPPAEKSPPWRGPVYEPYPERLAGFDHEPESYEALRDEVDQMPPTLGAKMMGLAYGPGWDEDEADVIREFRTGKKSSERELTNLKGLRSVESLVQHHTVRALEYGVESAFALEDWMRIRLSFQGACAYCGAMTGNRLTIDHVVALSKGGPNTPTNIVAACKPCNTSKNATPLLDWLETKGFDPAVVFKRINEAQARQRGES
jgi:hypothetical protein